MKYCILDPMLKDGGVGGFFFSRPQSVRPGFVSKNNVLEL